MLASKFTKTITNGTNGLSGVATTGVAGTKTNATAQFNNIYAPVANLTTADVKVDVGVQADVTAMFNFTSRGFSWDFGYNFWGRSCEDFECPNECDECNTDSIFNTANANTWALKGDARMFGFAGASGNQVTQDDSVPLSSSQTNANIHGGTNACTVDSTLTSVTFQNGGVDNPQFAVTDDTPRLVIHTPIGQGGLNVNSNQIKTSIQTIFIKSTDVSLQETRGISHTVFTHLSYTWDRDNWSPYLGLGGSAEFGSSCDSCCSSCTDDTACPTGSTCSTTCSTNCDECLRCSLSQWSIWVKGGVSFN